MGAQFEPTRTPWRPDRTFRASAGVVAIAIGLYVGPLHAAVAEVDQSISEVGDDLKVDPADIADASDGDLDVDASTDDIYRQVFGTERPTLGLGDYAVQISNIYVGDFAISPGPADSGSIEARFVRETLVPLIVNEKRAAFEALADNAKIVSFDALRDAGIQLQFDNARLVLQIDIPNEMRGVSDLYIRSIRRRDELQRIPQSRVSGYVSGRVGLTFVEDATSDIEGHYRTVADVDVAMNIHGIAAEAEFRYDDRAQRKFRRGDVRLTYDDRASLIRYEVGDLTIGRRPFQLAPRMAGVSAFRKYTINPYLDIRPSPEQQFQLERDARVQVFVNGVPTRSFDLGSGRYNLRGFPLVSSAANDVELLITYASGETERLLFPAFFDIDLLKPGLLDFAVNAGVPFRDEGGVRRYDTGNYNMTGYVRYGISEALTLGANWEGDRYFSNVGVETLWATRFGTFAFNLATDVRVPGLDSGRASLQYRWREGDPARDRTIDASLTMTGRNFRTLNNITGGDFVAKLARFRISQRVSTRGRAQIYGAYEDYRGFRDSYSVGVNYLHQFRFGNLSGSVEYRRTSEKSGLGFSVGMTIPFGRASLTASFDSQDNNARVFYNQVGANGIGSMSLNAAIERRDGADRQFVRASYFGNRFEATAEQTARNYFSDGGRDLRSDLTFGTALVMADGHFALSRPVTNSFAIFDADSAAGDHQLFVEPRVGFGSADVTYSGKSGALGPAVVTTLTPYFNRAIQVDAPDAPAGSSLGGEVFVLNPGYRSGYYITVGNDRNVSIVGNLTDRDGDVLAYVAGEAVLLDGNAESAEPDADTHIPLFTNAAGRFFVEGVEAGKSYRLMIDVDGRTISATVAVPEDAEGIFRLDTPIRFDMDAARRSEENENE
ncbi:fimbrial biogenesis outer membrane usher protein [Sphingopyxis sp. JAI128]|uniref:fimbrial biogenesis outer membrane usher protein n=1 Tax=Sphingopyxis sp. JAI128 TaxID=2723066 RepID=UPI00161317BD|nr:fimbrial biogenesis outer membrane usher protein [Sphingopyxis sp. JAI128]MBB6427479.1 outer membrane usher protein [Sphingopyxis sp. JAI128]